MLDKVWSQDQNRIFVTGLNGERRHIIIGASAGSGKTTTLVELARLISEDERYQKAKIVFLAFGKGIVGELNSRLSGNASAKTINSAGNGAVYGVLKKTNLDERKYRKLATKWVEENGTKFDPAERNAIAASLYKLADFARKTLVDTSNISALREMCLHFDIELEHPSALFEALPVILGRGRKMAERERVIDYVDQIWLPIVWDLSLPKHDFVLVDECQDLSACQLALVKKMLSPEGRAIFVGDRFQSIMGFGGADNRSFDKIKQEMNAIELPLSVCYRCPASHIALAQMIVPEIQPRKGAPEGTISHLKADEDLSKIVQGGDLILCRLTAPLISECIRLIKSSISAKVRGRSIGEDLISLLEKIGRIEGFSYATVVRCLQDYLEKQIGFLRQKEADESIIESLTDRVECLQVCASNFPANSIEELSRAIEGLFSEDRPTVWLSTVHRAKGLEAKRIFVLKPEKLPLRWKSQQGWQFEQERNLVYVALTRAQEALYFLGDLPDLCQAREKIQPELEAVEAAQDATEDALEAQEQAVEPLVWNTCYSCGSPLQSALEQAEGTCDFCAGGIFGALPPAPSGCYCQSDGCAFCATPAQSAVPAQTNEIDTAITLLDSLVHDKMAMYRQGEIREAVEELTRLWNEAKSKETSVSEEYASVDECCPICGKELLEDEELLYCPEHGGPLSLLIESQRKREEEEGWNSAHPY